MVDDDWKRDLKESDYTLDAVVTDVIDQLNWIFVSNLEKGKFGKFFRSRYNLMDRDRSINEIKIVEGHIERVKDLKGKAKIRMSLETAICVAIYFCHRANLMQESNNPDRAWYFVAQANRALGISWAFANNLRSWHNANRDLAKSGGDGRALKFKILEAETIRLYKLGRWDSTPLADMEIKPKIIAMSKDGNGNLAITTTKPIQWIRAHIKFEKSNPS